MIRKLRSKTAMTFSELLVAIAIMALVFAAVGMGISVAMRTLRTMSLSSESAILCDTLASAISDELRYATEIGTVSGNVTFNSKNFGNGATISSNSEGRIVCTADSSVHQLLGDRAYSFDLIADVVVTYSDTNGVFGVRVWAYTSDDPGSRWAETTISVRALNYLPA